MGFDFAARTCTCFGSPAQKIAFTSTTDVARALAELCILVSRPQAVPDDVRIAGTIASFADIAHMYAPDVVVRSVDLAEAKERVRADFAADPTIPPADHIRCVGEGCGEGDTDRITRVLMGEGKMDWSAENANELVNPDQRGWKWKMIHEQVAEMRAAST